MQDETCSMTPSNRQTPEWPQATKTLQLRLYHSDNDADCIEKLSGVNPGLCLARVSRRTSVVVRIVLMQCHSQSSKYPVQTMRRSGERLSAGREHDLANVFGGIDQLVSAARIGERKALVHDGLDLACRDMRPHLAFQFIDDRSLVCV